jgi:hypothetical protein
MVGGVTVSAPATVVPFTEALTLTLVLAETGVVVATNVMYVVLAGTVTVAGTDTLLELETKFTTVPLAPEAAVSVTVPVDELPPSTEDGEKLMLAMVAGLIVSVAIWAEVPSFAVIMAEVVFWTPEVLIGNVAEDCPGAIGTVGGT